MNSKKGSSFDFDFNLSSTRSSSSSKPLNQQSSSYSSSYSSMPKPAWTHQPLPTQPVRPTLSTPTSMVGDISGKSWNSTPLSSNSNIDSDLGIGIVQKNSNLFGDLLGSALGQSNKIGNSNVPLKNAAPLSVQQTGSKNAFSMGNLGSSLPKTSSPSVGGYNIGNSYGKGGNLGGVGMKSGGLGAVGVEKKDPFGSLVDFSSKKETNVKASNNSGNVNLNSSGSGDYAFGDFQNAAKSATPSSNSNANMDGFGDFGMPTQKSATASNNSMGSNSKMDSFGDFEIPIQKNTSSIKQPQGQGGDGFDMLFSSSSEAPIASGASGGQPFSEMDDWNLESEFAGDEAGGTTELDGLPPPPAGVNVSIAKNKGMESYKQGQHPDAIKWLTWAVVLLEKAGDSANVEVLSCRASCYKEVGEYKKAIADCTKVLEQDVENVAVLTQRALLYESTEKYRLGAEDLKTVLRIDPSNRLAKSTIHRLTQMAG